MAPAATRAKNNAASPSAAKHGSAAKAATQELEIRYSKIMKPQRVYALSVAVPKAKSGRGDGGGGIVVVRPQIAGAQVVPAEQRLEIEPGNVVIFHVTPLAKGRLPRARLDIFAPGKAPDAVPLAMKVKTQRLALLLLLLAWAVPALMGSLTSGDLQPTVRDRFGDLQPTVSESTLRHYLKNTRVVDTDIQKLRAHFEAPMTDKLPPVPFFNRPIETLEGDWGSFTLSEAASIQLSIGYAYLAVGMVDYPWLPNVVAAGFLFLAFAAWMLHDPRRKRIWHELELRPSSGGAETALLEPI